MRLSPLVVAALLLAALPLSGCLSLDQITRELERLPRSWDPRGAGSADARTREDVRDYVRDVDRAVQLDGRQTRQIEDVLVNRTARLQSQSYPFPRDRATSREAEAWWRDSDRQIDQVLSRRQQDDYRDFVDRIEGRGYDRGRYDDDGYEDQDVGDTSV